MHAAESFDPTSTPETAQLPSDHTAILAALLRRLRTCVSARDDALFTEFLPRGYALMTLSTVPAVHATELLYAKVRVGMLITLYDDQADHPRRRDRAVLRALCRLPFAPATPGAPPLVHLAAALWHEVEAVIRRLPQYTLLRDLFAFDLHQVYQAMRYSELLGDLPALANRTENRAYLAHNMGLVLVGMMDLMALPTLPENELGRIRTFLLLGQEVARLSNVLCTWEREVAEGDYTSEVAAMGIEDGVIDAAAAQSPCTHASQSLLATQVAHLSADQARLLSQVEARADSIQAFDAHRYVAGLRALHGLHQELQAKL
ncbi:MAG TPA: hypothetical protein VFH51_10695 [Myxococcota bacterium]|nr:hypothetical protein [Myxococcota bacterium]